MMRGGGERLKLKLLEVSIYCDSNMFHGKDSGPVFFQDISRIFVGIIYEFRDFPGFQRYKHSIMYHEKKILENLLTRSLFQPNFQP